MLSGVPIVDMAGWFDTLKSAAGNLAAEASKVAAASGLLGNTLQMGARSIAIGHLLADGGSVSCNCVSGC